MAKQIRIRVRFTPEELRLVRRAARRDGYTCPARWLLHLALDASGFPQEYNTSEEG